MDNDNKADSEPKKDDVKANGGSEKVKAAKSESTPKAKTKRDGKNENRRTLGDWFGDIKGEFKKITWPDRKSVIKDTVTVVATSAIVGLIVCGFDLVFEWAYQLLVTLVG